MREGAGVGDQAVTGSAPWAGSTPLPSDPVRPLLRILDLDQQMWVERLSPRARTRRIRTELGMSQVRFDHLRHTAFNHSYCYVERPRIMRRLLQRRAEIRAMWKLTTELRRV
jgi:hypothetical protein